MWRLVHCSTCHSASHKTPSPLCPVPATPLHCHAPNAMTSYLHLLTLRNERLKVWFVPDTPLPKIQVAILELFKVSWPIISVQHNLTQKQYCTTNAFSQTFWYKAQNRNTCYFCNILKLYPKLHRHNIINLQTYSKPTKQLVILYKCTYLHTNTQTQTQTHTYTQTLTHRQTHR